MRRTIVSVGLAAVVTVLAGSAGAQPPPGNGPHSPDGTILEPDAIPFSSELLDRLEVADGFEIGVFAQDAGNVRMMSVRPNGDVYVTRRQQGDVLLVRDTDGDAVADERRTVAQNLPLVHGITIVDDTVYLVATTQVYRASITDDGSFTPLETIVDDLPDPGQHSARTIAMGPDGLLYVSIGSTCNNCEEANPENATLIRLRPDGTFRTVYSRGLRHNVGFDWHPDTGQLWGMDMQSDWRGDDQPPEELNELVRSGDYGWPYCFGEGQPDPFAIGQPPGTTKATYCAGTEHPALMTTAHSSPIGMTFYTGDQFPADHNGDAFVALRGSWNRSEPSGYKVVRIDFDDAGRPMGFEDFVTGWLIPAEESPIAGSDRPAQFGRVAGVAQWTDGSLLVSEDQGGVIYRISRAGSPAAASIASKVVVDGGRDAATPPSHDAAPELARPVSVTEAAAVGDPSDGWGAAARLHDADGEPVGLARFRVRGDDLQVHVEVDGLETGRHGTHIHERGECAVGPDAATGEPVPFGAAGGHFDPATTRTHGRPAQPAAEAHAGDLPNLRVGDDGRGEMWFRTVDLSLGDDPRRIVGRSLVVHADRDDYSSQPAGASGTRVACGVILIEASDLQQRYLLPPGNVYPEGVVADGGAGAFYVGSSATGTIYRFQHGAPEAQVFSWGGSPGRTSALGMDIDGAGNLYIAGGTTGEVAVLSTTDAAPVARLTSPQAPHRFLNDVTVAGSHLYVTDSVRPVLFRAALPVEGEVELEPWLDLSTTPIGYGEGFNLNGIVATDDGRYLFAVQSNTGQLWRVDTGSGAVHEIGTGGVDLTNGDGMLLEGDVVHVVRNRDRQIVTLRLGADAATAEPVRERTVPDLMFPTTLDRLLGDLLVVNGQLDKRSSGQPPMQPFTVVALSRP